MRTKIILSRISTDNLVYLALVKLAICLTVISVTRSVFVLSFFLSDWSTTWSVIKKHTQCNVLWSDEVGNVFEPPKNRIKDEDKFNSNLMFVSIMFQQPDCCLWICSVGLSN